MKPKATALVSVCTAFNLFSVFLISLNATQYNQMISLKYLLEIQYLDKYIEGISYLKHKTYRFSDPLYKIPQFVNSQLWTLRKRHQFVFWGSSNYGCSDDSEFLAQNFGTESKTLLNLWITKESKEKALPYRWQLHSLTLQIQSFS